jgi:predicted P-loop ATPase
MEKEPEWEVNFKRITVKMSDGSVFTGKVNIRGFQRLSDYLRTTDDRFLVILSEDGQLQKVMMVNKNYILWAEAAD